MHAPKQKLVLRSLSVLMCGPLVIISAQNLKSLPVLPWPVWYINGPVWAGS